MKIVPEIAVSDYDYVLPDERIAKFPVENRELSKLLIYRNGEIHQSIFTDITNLLETDSLLVFNNTRVVQARLNFKKITGATIEIFILNPINPSDYNVSFLSTVRCTWKCIVGNLKRWKGEILEMSIPNSCGVLKAQRIRAIGEGIEVEFIWDNPELSFAEVIELCGMVPIPPYLNRKPVNNDKKSYQTVYAKLEGSVAAPTAGLHFTPELIKGIQQRGIDTEFVTLHVGAGTFKPIKSNTVSDHEMHTEHFFINTEVIAKLKMHSSVTSVGTTTLRTLESLYWLGVKLKIGLLDMKNPFLEQWEPYRLPNDIPLLDSLCLLENWLKNANTNHITASTQLCIVPGYQFRVVDTLITNYHQPRSTLLLLVAAFIGNDWKRVYNYALENEFRFLSYGDSSLLFRNQ